MQTQNQYQFKTAHAVVKAANDNYLPKNYLLSRLFKISLFIAPIILWLLWMQ